MLENIKNFTLFPDGKGLIKRTVHSFSYIYFSGVPLASVLSLYSLWHNSEISLEIKKQFFVPSNLTFSFEVFLISYDPLLVMNKH